MPAMPAVHRKSEIQTDPHPTSPPLDPLPAHPYTPPVTADAADRDRCHASPSQAGCALPSARVAQAAAPCGRDGTLPRHAEDPE